MSQNGYGYIYIFYSGLIQGDPQAQYLHGNSKRRKMQWTDQATNKRARVCLVFQQLPGASRKGQIKTKPENGPFYWASVHQSGLQPLEDSRRNQAAGPRHIQRKKAIQCLRTSKRTAPSSTWPRGDALQAKCRKAENAKTYRLDLCAGAVAIACE